MWKFLKIKKLKLGEDLTRKDKETRTKLWPQIEEEEAREKSLLHHSQSHH